jgi:hypothetical protein
VIVITLRQVRRSAGLYPITLLYVGAVCLIVSVATSVISGLAAICFLGFTAILLAFYATWRELRTVHTLVDGQRTELLTRIDQLSHLLQSSGIVVPVGTKIEQDARDDTIRRSM